jgi:hypothetical protein
MLFRQRVKTVTHVAELLSFVQNRIRMHGYTAFLRTLKKRQLQVVDLVQ